MKIKDILALLFLLFFNTSILFAQKELDIIYLKDGSIITGHIFVDLSGKLVKIESLYGTVIMFPYGEIEKISKAANSVNLDDYGRGFSGGASLSSGLFNRWGMIEVPLRFQLSPKFYIETAAGYRFVSINPRYPQEIKVYHSATLSAGPVIYFKKSFKFRNQKVKANGLAFRVGYTYGTFPEGLFTIGWINETFRVKDKSFIFETGLGISSLTQDQYRPEYKEINEPVVPVLYAKCRWNFYKEKAKK